MRAMLTDSVPEFTRPMNSSMVFGLFPTALTMLGVLIFVGIFDSPIGAGGYLMKVNRMREK